MIKILKQTTPSAAEREAERLFKNLLHVECDSKNRWTLEACRRIAPLTLEINRLKKEKNAILLAHSYVEPEIIYGVADFKGDSYQLSVDASRTKAEIIVFSGVVFMAETAKILSPHTRVFIPDRNSGCSLADSITGDQLRKLKDAYPDAATVSYINCGADVKAESDVCVTSTNVYDIISQLPQREILFVPDRLMGENIRVELRRRGIGKKIFTSNGTCIVHDQFNPDLIEEAKARYPGLAVVAHPECLPEVIRKSDFVGSTGAMMEFVRKSDFPYYMMLTECGLVSRLEIENPGKNFIGSCKLCPFMKLNSLEKIRNLLLSPTPEQEIKLEKSLREKAEKSLRRMISLTETKRKMRG